MTKRYVRWKMPVAKGLVRARSWALHCLALSMLLGCWVFGPRCDSAWASGYYNRVMWVRPQQASCATPAFVQSVSARTFSQAYQLSQDLTPTAGNLLVAVVYSSAPDPTTVFTVADTLGNTWSRAPMSANGAGPGQVQIFYATNATSAFDEVSVYQDMGSSTGLYLGLHVLEYSGVVPVSASPVDATSQQAAASVTSVATPGNMDLGSTGCPELVIAGAFSSAATLSAGSGWTSRTYDSTARAMVEDNAASLALPGSSINASFTLGTATSSWTAAQIAFRAQGSGPAPAAFIQTVPRQAYANQVSSVRASQTITEGAGHFLVAVSSTIADIPESGVAISDTLGNTWYATPPQRQLDQYSEWRTVQIFYAPNVLPGTNTITALQLPPYNTDTGGELSILEYSGIAPTSAVDIAGGRGAPSSTTLNTAGNMTLAPGTKELVVAAYFSSNGGAYVPGPGWLAQGYDTWLPTFVEDNSPAFTAGGSTVNAQATLTPASAYWAVTQVAFRQSTSSAPLEPVRLAIATSAQTLTKTWQCSGALTIQSQDASGTAAIAHTPIPLTLSASGVTFYADSSCARPITSSLIYAGSNSQTIYFTGQTAGNASITVSSSGFTSTNQSETVTALAPFTWIGGAGCNGNWNSSVCWSGGVAPTSASQAVYFDSNCSLNCTAHLVSSVTIGRLAFSSDATSSLVLGSFGLTISAASLSGGLDLGGGSITLGTGSLVVGGTLWVSGGTFTGGSGPLTTSKGLLVTGGTLTLGTGLNTAHWIQQSGGSLTLNGVVQVTQDYLILGGTISGAGATLKFLDNSTNNPIWSIAPGNTAYGNVQFADQSSATIVRVLGAGSTLVVNGNVTLGSSGANAIANLCGGTVEIHGDLTLIGLGSDCEGTGLANQFAPTNIKMAGATSQLIDASSTTTGMVPSLELASTGGTVMFKGNPIIFGNYAYTSGTIDFSTWSSVLTFAADYGLNRTWTIDPGNITYGAVSFLDSTPYIQFRAMGTGKVMKVAGTLTLGSASGPLASSLCGGTIEARGDVILADQGYVARDCTPTLIQIAGSANQVLDASQTSTGYIPSLEFKSNATITLKGRPIVFGNYTYTSGSVDFITYSPTLAFSDTASYSGNWTVAPGNINYGNVDFEDTSAYSTVRSFASGSTLRVTGTLGLNGQSTYGNSLCEGTITALGDVVVENYGYLVRDCTPTLLQMAGTGAQLLDASSTSTGSIPSLQLAGTGTITLKGTPSIVGNYTYTSGSVDFATNGAGLAFNDRFDDNPAWSITPGPIAYGTITFGETTPYASTRNISGAMNIQGDLNFQSEQVWHEVDGGSLTVSGNVNVQNAAGRINSNIAVGGNWTAASGSVLNAVGGTVTLAPGASHTIGGTTQFFNLTLDDSAITSADTLSLPSGKTQSIAGILTLKGNTTNRLKIWSATSGVQATLNMTNAQTLGSWLDVKDVKISGGKTVHTGLNSIGTSTCPPTQNTSGLTCP